MNYKFKITFGYKACFNKIFALKIFSKNSFNISNGNCLCAGEIFFIVFRIACVNIVFCKGKCLTLNTAERVVKLRFIICFDPDKIFFGKTIFFEFVKTLKNGFFNIRKIYTRISCNRNCKRTCKFL